MNQVGGQAHLVEQALGRRRRADEADRGDLRGVALLDRDRNADPVALERRDRRGDACRVAAAREYWRLISCSARSRIARSKMRDSASLLAQRLQLQRVLV
ncbi:MAG: hypothetical protein R3E41_08805 [Burkholderiaceae bacterium]